MVAAAVNEHVLATVGECADVALGDAPVTPPNHWIHGGNRVAAAAAGAARSIDSSRLHVGQRACGLFCVFWGCVCVRREAGRLRGLNSTEKRKLCLKTRHNNNNTL